jgi:hypothetical protein
LWDLRPDITSCRNVAVWNLRSCFCGAPSLTTGRVCNLQCNHWMVRVAQNPSLYFTVSSETRPTWRAMFPYVHPPGTGWSNYTSGHLVFEARRRSKVEVTIRLAVSRSVCLGIDLLPDITSCRNVAVWNLRSWFCGAPSLTRGRVCNLQCNHSMICFGQSQSQSYFATESLSVSTSWRRTHFGTYDQMFFSFRILMSEVFCLVSFWAPSLTRGRVCHLFEFIYKDPVRTSQENTTELSRLMLIGETVAVYVKTIWNTQIQPVCRI